MVADRGREFPREGKRDVTERIVRIVSRCSLLEGQSHNPGVKGGWECN